MNKQTKYLMRIPEVWDHFLMPMRYFCDKLKLGDYATPIDKQIEEEVRRDGRGEKY